MDLWQAIIGLIVALSALVGAVALSVRISASNSKQAMAILDRELSQEKEDSERLRGRVSELEENRKERSLTIKTLEKNITTLLRQMEEMQEWKKGAEKKLEKKDAEITRLNAENDRVKSQNADLFKSNQAYQSQHKTWREVITILALDKSENNTESHAPIPVQVMGSIGETIENNQEKKEDED